MPIDELVNQRVLQPPTMLPWGDDGPRERLIFTPDYKSRAVQGYADDSEPIGQLGEQTSGVSRHQARGAWISRVSLRTNARVKPSRHLRTKYRDCALLPCPVR
jgi:hypothetical protein